MTNVVWHNAESLWQVHSTACLYSPGGSIGLDGLAAVSNCVFWLGARVWSPYLPYPGGVRDPLLHNVLLDPASVPVQWHPKPSNSLSKVHECDRRQTRDDKLVSAVLLMRSCILIFNSPVTVIAIRGVARIFGLGGGQTMSCGARPCEHRSCEAHAGVWVLPQKNFADPNAWNAFSQHLAPSP